MKYSDGSNILLGDIVTLGGGMTGIVVCNFEEGWFTQDFDKDEWRDYTTGVMIASNQAGLVYYPEESVDLSLIRRATVHPSHKEKNKKC
ncbi:hypothetical protein [Citrobacter rodentium]|jgi:hypothetical protein|uniref:Uncharacterized protein n=2 Tax=Citrobacter rodentium TaxID=67825 RepID=D2TSD8_CITRI|nr:hypothetical protein [Citrobacter rodentium]QBY28867.1 hypothetical protein E2R62_08340 [Citrobacter rodentium]UHO29269.1 hypothetical protein K7R23_14555 [Citrobacter rodentium NBRC 105723 = DSM 16636]CBG89104.1 hypothetical protein ROD_23581 [Citrobacter rodentium ICC168]HAT8013454.1 hypothetical protein [Citrobacter rodentium NBRC 105723 = DSM 16636]HAT8018476.1 hypothetical protein [Citrobacter rodentium]